MPKNKAEDQALCWLYSKSCDTENVFDAINAANAINIIRQRNKQLKSLGAHFCNLKKQRDRFKTELEKSSEIFTEMFEEYFGKVPCRLCEKLKLLGKCNIEESELGIRFPSQPCPSWKDVWAGLLKEEET